MSSEKDIYGPVFHGGTWNGKGKIKLARGALGHGAYFTPDIEYARGYVKQGNLIKAYLKITNPLIVDLKTNEKGRITDHPCVVALVNLGMNKDKAYNKVEKIEEEKGYLGKEISGLAIKQGYDALLLAVNGKVTEVVIWKSEQVYSTE